MEILHRSCAGIDIGKRSLTVCVITSGPLGEPAKATRTFGTLTSNLLAMADWLEGAGVTAVAMEATGSYWKPIYNLLEDRFELLLANAAHLKAVPGARPTSATRSGSPSSSATACCARASSHRRGSPAPCPPGR